MKIKLLFAILLISLLITAFPAEAHTRDKMPEPPYPTPETVILEQLDFCPAYRPPPQPPYEGHIDWYYQEAIMFRCFECK
jgi:hypothetical protein